MRKILFYLIPLLLFVSCKENSNNKTDKRLPVSSFKAEMLVTAPVAVAVGTTHENYMATNFRNANVLRLDGLSDLSEMVSNKKVKFALTNSMIVPSILKERNNLILLDDNLFTLDVAIAFNKNRGDLRDEYNEFLKEFKKTDTFKNIIKRWLADSSGGDIPNIEIPATGKKLICSVCSGAVPNVTMVNNKIEGLDIEIVRHFAKAKGYKVEFIDANFSAMISFTATGKGDMMAAGIAVTEERKKKFIFSDPHLTSRAAVFGNTSDWVDDKKEYKDFVKPEIKAIGHNGATNVDDTMRCYISKGKVAVIEGTIQEQYVSSVLPREQVLVVKEYSDALLNLLSNKSDFILTNYGVAKTFQSKEESLEIVLTDVFSFDISIGLNKKDKKLKEELNSFIAECRKSGKLDELYNKWFTELSDGRIADYKLDRSAKTIRLGTSGTATPFSFVAEGKSQGLDIEIMYMFCKENGYNLEITKMPFGALVSSIMTGKVDAIANTLSGTAERRKSIDFTDPYSKNSFTLLFNREVIGNNNFEDKEDGFFASTIEAFKNNIIKEDRYKMILDGLRITVIISLLSILLGTLFGMIICYLSMSKSAFSRTIANMYITIVRGIPVLVLLMINFYVIFAKTPISPIFVATLSFAMNFAAYVSEMFRSSIIGIEKGQTEAGLAMGFTKIQTFIYIVAPQAIKRVLPVFKGESISLVKMTSIVGYIAVQDITKVGDIIRSRTFDAFFPLLVSALLYFLIAFVFAKLIDLSTSKITKRN